jgi:hypothetical protein
MLRFVWLLVALLIIELLYYLILYNKHYYNCIRIDHHQAFDVLITGLILTTTMIYSTNVTK